MLASLSLYSPYSHRPARGLEYGPYLLTLTIRTPDGAPVPNAHLDFWQATTKGMYYYSSYNLRGKFTTDEQGRVEILTIAPGAYGPTNTVLRAGHFHLWINGGEQFDPLTTQLYVCPGNAKDGMLQDLCVVHLTADSIAWSRADQASF